MSDNSYDVRSSTCQGGGGLWAFLSHVRDVHQGDILELVTDDALAVSDIPAWTQKMGWVVAHAPHEDGQRFVVRRPA